ncbi:DUF819 family protein [Carboxylicivirga mesophila]|uniref:DUF819 family protein n=1 Tax=Carboxylicivirga mesophila TaxID=1166478 RepID=A0ABS5K777_9BACT|nr:DUF819 family protein [Carboxylicivirga mesophila]MBS2210846.1 DUF819 family protein [Carboxylicivirga mesophila]
MNSIINADQHFLVLAMVTGAAAFGIWSEHKKWFGKVSGILVTMISMSLLAMLGVVPVGSGTGVSVPVYDMVFDYFIPISIPLLLLSSNIVKIIKESGKLLLAFIVGAVGVVIGCFIAFYIIDLGDDAGNTAGVIAATLVGGSINFVATGETLNFSTNPYFSATIAVDNFAANLYVLFLFLVPALAFLKRFWAPVKEDVSEKESVGVNQSPITMERIGVTLFLAVLIAAGGGLLAPYLQQLFGTELNLGILVITLLSLLVANLFPKKLMHLEHTAFSIGLWMMYAFLAVIGASTNIYEVLKVGPSLLLFYLIIMVFHFLFLMVTARVLKLNVYEVIVSSAANIMGPSVAAPMAASLGQKKMVTPAILVGILGYVIGTFIGVSIALTLA